MPLNGTPGGSTIYYAWSNNAECLMQTIKHANEGIPTNKIF